MKMLEREIGSINYVAGQTISLPLPRNYAYRALNLWLRCTAARDNTAHASTNLPQDCIPGPLVKNIMIRANGRDVIKSFDHMGTIHRLNHIRYGVRPYITQSLNWHSGAQVAAGIMKLAARIDFAMWNAYRPIDTLFDSSALSTLELIITWGTGIELMDDSWLAEAGAAVTVTAAATQLYISSEEEVGVPAGTKFMINKESVLSRQLAATGALQIPIPVGNMYRSFVIRTRAGNDLVNTILQPAEGTFGTITLKSGTEVYKYRIGQTLQADNKLDFRMENPEVNLLAAGAALDHVMISNILPGFYVLEFCKDGMLTEALDTRNLSDLTLELAGTVSTDVGGTAANNFIDVIPCELIAPSIAA